MKKWIDNYRRSPRKWIFWLLFLAVIGSMLPIWYISRFTVMGRDDFYYGLQTHQAWLATHSLARVLRAAAATTVEYWHQWQGTYSSIFLMTLAPGILAEEGYFLTTFLMTGMLGGSLAVLLHVFLKEYAGCKDRYLRGISILVLTFLAIQTMVSPVDGIFWYNGSLHYVFMQSVLFFMLAAMLTFRVREKKGQRIWYLVLAGMLGLVTGGANLLTALQSVICYALLLLADLLLTKKKRNLWLAAPFFVTLIGFGFNVLAPGNLIREGTGEGMGAVTAVLASFYWALVFITEWMTPIVLAGFALLLPVIFRAVEKASHRFLHPALAVFFSYCVFAAMFTPTLFATSSEGPDRCKNIMRITLYVLVFVNLVNAAGYMQSKKGSLLEQASALIRQKEAAWLLACTGLLLFVFLFAADKNTYVSVSALRSIVNGEAVQFYEENKIRLDQYNDPAQKTVTVKPLSVHPYLLHTTDVGNEGSTDYWVTLALEKYYQKDSIRLEE